MRVGRLGTALLAGAIAFAPVRAAVAEPPASFVFGGAGYGHGVGMSQYGARGQALAGRRAADITRHYYTGTRLSALPDGMNVRVNLLHLVSSAQLRTRALAAGGGAFELVVAGAGSVRGGSADTVSLGTSGGLVTVRVMRADGRTSSYAGPAVSVRWAGTRFLAGAATLLDVAGPGERLGDGSGLYRRGAVEVKAHSGRLEVLTSVRLHDEYLYGVAEMPSSWPSTALQAQVHAARTYALASYGRGTLRGDCLCHLWDSVYSQVYAGWAKEGEPTWGARWVAAVRETQASRSTGWVVTYGGRPITAFFFSSSNGRTEDSEDVFGTALPYARSVADPWSADPANNPTYAAWELSRTQAELGGAFGLPDVVRLDLGDRNPTGTVRSAVAMSSEGATATLTGPQLRSALALPSTTLRRPYDRLAGVDRYATAVAVARAGAPSARTVVIVNGTRAHLVDGLVAAPLARAHAAPVLLATATSVPSATLHEIDRRGVSTAYLVGGDGALGVAVRSALRQRGVAFTQLSGRTRYGTAAAVARVLGGTRPAAVVASGADEHLVDALAAAGPAARTGRPVLLVRPDRVPAETATVLGELGVARVTVVGGPAAVSDDVLASLPGARRVAGPDRYATAASVSDAFRERVGTERAVLTSGAEANLVDALAAGALGRLTVLVSGRTPLPAATRTWLQRTPDLGGVTVVGGPGAVPAAVVLAARDA